MYLCLNFCLYVKATVVRTLTSGGFPELALYIARGGTLPPVTAGSAFPPRPHLSSAVRGTLTSKLQHWEEALEEYLGDDPNLQTYVKDPLGYEAILPHPTSALAQRLKRLGDAARVVGELDVARRCYDVAGDDWALFELLLQAGKQATPGGELSESVQEIGRELMRANETSQPNLHSALACCLDVLAGGNVSSGHLGLQRIALWPSVSGPFVFVVHSLCCAVLN